MGGVEMSIFTTNTISPVSGTIVAVDGSLSVQLGTTLNSTLVSNTMNANGSFVVSGATNFNGGVTVTGLSAASITTNTTNTSCSVAPTLPKHLARKDYVDRKLIGISNQWYDLTGSRSASTQYTNDTSGPIMVAVVGITVPTLAVIVNGVTLQVYNSTTSKTYSVSFIVPSGHTYQFNTSAIRSWAEFR